MVLGEYIIVVFRYKAEIFDISSRVEIWSVLSRAFAWVSEHYKNKAFVVSADGYLKVSSFRKLWCTFFMFPSGVSEPQYHGLPVPNNSMVRFWSSCIPPRSCNEGKRFQDTFIQYLQYSLEEFRGRVPFAYPFSFVNHVRCAIKVVWKYLGLERRMPWDKASFKLPDPSVRLVD